MTHQIAATQTHPSILFAEVCQAISIDRVADLLSCGKTHVYKQKAHPELNGEARTSFIEKVERMTAAVMEKNPNLARKIVARLCRICGGKFVIDCGAKADKATLIEELLDNYSALTEYARIKQDPNSTEDDKIAAKIALFEEIEQDFDERLK